jgi:GH25 family lysozyme M1 (1,4-beta-N-acetylmuramidase)
MKKLYVFYIILGMTFLVAMLLIFVSKKRKPLIENTWLTESDYTFGLDVSHYQGVIDWEAVTTSHHPIKFVFIRSTMGYDGKDEQFKANWDGAKEIGLLRGAYHYYRPNEDPVKQFENFSSMVVLDTGDLPPVLDIEAHSIYGMDSLRKNLQVWLELCEEHYGIKPIIYTGLTYYQNFLHSHFSEYPLWVAAYTGGKPRLGNLKWTFHQFTEKVKVSGIYGRVDGNDFVGKLHELEAMTFGYAEVSSDTGGLALEP